MGVWKPSSLALSQDKQYLVTYIPKLPAESDWHHPCLKRYPGFLPSLPSFPHTLANLTRSTSLINYLRMNPCLTSPYFEETDLTQRVSFRCFNISLDWGTQPKTKTTLHKQRAIWAANPPWRTGTKSSRSLSRPPEPHGCSVSPFMSVLFLSPHTHLCFMALNHSFQSNSSVSIHDCLSFIIVTFHKLFKNLKIKFYIKEM